MFTQNSKWIECDGGFSSPVVIKKFRADEPDKAIIDITGLGYYELFINGKRISAEFFKPAVSDYSKRDFSKFLYPSSDETSHSIYFNSFDVTKYLLHGENVLAVMLGNGFYRQNRRKGEGETSFGERLMLRFDLHLTKDGEKSVISSDETVLQAEGFIKENNLFFGEEHDYAYYNRIFGKELQSFKSVEIASSPRAKLRKQKCPNDVIRERIVPKVIKRKEESVIYDAGKNLSGFVILKCLDEQVKVRHAEEISDGELDFSSSGRKQISENRYLNAKGKTVHPWFSWSGFRYFEVFGKAEEVTVAYLSSDVEVISEFECQNETLNWLFRAYLNTQLSNMHGGVPSDCPHRERLGYTGDGQLTAECAMLTLDCRSFYEKWIRDIADCQDKKTGHIQHTAPFLGGGGGPGGWGCAMVAVPYSFYKIYGDEKILKRYYKNMLGYLDSMKGFCEDHLVVKEREKGWCLGDWCTFDEVKLPEPFVNTFYYVKSMQTVKEIALIIGEKADFDALIKSSLEAMENKFFDPATGDFCGGVQGANAFGLSLGLGDERTKARLLAHYRSLKAFDTGIFGTEVLCDYLVKQGELQLLFEILTSEKCGSFGYMKNSGATTLWEYWQGKCSHNHPMFGSCIKQLFYGFLGIKADAGLENIEVSPKYIEGMGFIKAKLKTQNGEIGFDYKYLNGEVKCEVKEIK